MSHRDQFPPNKFLKKTIMKTPGRFLVFIFGLCGTILLSGKFYPQQTMDVCLGFLLFFLPISIGLTIWMVVWYIIHPAPPRPRCPECHQLMPEKDDE